MLDADTRRRIDNARDILVGKVPDPKSQVEQITIALIYKFMNDIDRQSEELGGVPTFFSGDFEQYRWTNLVHGALSGNEMLKLYTDALDRMPQNQNIPLFFRSIFDNAYLPYNSPETLRLFLRAIDKFPYDNPEHLGDAYEYLLSVLGSQGDAGQFRTPRHIIDFIVSIVDPQKRETILDPACGTAGFLISAYKHIQNANTDGQGASALTSDEKDHLANSILGYDISPEMTRLSRVNMYLHGLADPRVHEYDTLTSEDRWNERADIILANPPFMSPKGGITPHKRFSIASNRSEALFVDYIASHLTPTGRAGVIVPEGVLFRTQTAYVRLRRMLVESCLAAVVSLPSGVFNPYSGVKTSILILDPALARASDRIAFLKVEADGFNLGAQRRPIPNNDLPTVRAELAEFLQRERASENLNDYAPTRGFAVERSRILNHQDCTLSPERYRPKETRPSKWPLTPLGDVCKIERGDPITRKEVVEGPYPVIAAGRQPSAYHNQYNRSGETITISSSGYAGFVAYFDKPIFASDCLTLACDSKHIVPKLCFHLLKHSQNELYAMQTGTGQRHVYAKDIAQFQIPLPPLDLQREIVAEIDAYQRVIDGARLVLESYRPHIPIDPSWPLVQLGEVSTVIAGQSPPGESYNDTGLGMPFYQGKAEFRQVAIGPPKKWTTEPQRLADEGDILMSVRAPVGPVNITTSKVCIGRGLAAIRPSASYLNDTYLFITLRNMEGEIAGNAGAVFPSINRREIEELQIPLPPLETQQRIAADLELERVLVDANRTLTDRMESRIAAAVSRVWSAGDG